MCAKGKFIIRFTTMKAHIEYSGDANQALLAISIATLCQFRLRTYILYEQLPSEYRNGSCVPNL